MHMCGGVCVCGGGEGTEKGYVPKTPPPVVPLPRPPPQAEAELKILCYQLSDPVRLPQLLTAAHMCIVVSGASTAHHCPHVQCGMCKAG